MLELVSFFSSVQLIAMEKLTKIQNQCINDITLQLLNQANNKLHMDTLPAESVNSIYVASRGKISDLSLHISPTSENITQETQKKRSSLVFIKYEQYKNSCPFKNVNILTLLDGIIKNYYNGKFYVIYRS